MCVCLLNTVPFCTLLFFINSNGSGWGALALSDCGLALQRGERLPLGTRPPLTGSTGRARGPPSSPPCPQHVFSGASRLTCRSGGILSPV